jgi:ABC-type transporter Mla MlaB component
MYKNADIIFENAEFSLTGDLSFYNVMSVYRKSLQYMTSCPTLSFDFGQLKSSDSSGLALAIEWIKLADQHKKSIVFKNLSKNLQALALASGLDKLLA